MTAADQIIISCPEDNPVLRKSAEHLAQSLGLPFAPHPEEPPAKLLILYLSDTGLELRINDISTGYQSSLYFSFTTGRVGYRLKHNLNISQPLARAVGIKRGFRPFVLDATAGMGIDGLTLARLGCRVCMIERSPIIGALLKDALVRAEKDNLLGPIIQELIEFKICDAIMHMETIARKPYTVYLDPMYPHREKSALNKIEMRVIRKLVGDDSDSQVLFNTAFKTASNRIVVKRPKGAPTIDNRAPSHTVMMKNGRFDVYLIA